MKTKLHENQLNLLRHLARFQLLSYADCLTMLDMEGTASRKALTSITLLIVNFRCCGYHYYEGYMGYIKTLPLPPPRCRSVPHQLPPASAVCKEHPNRTCCR